MITSNLPFSRWEAIFKDPMTTAAAIDRLVHHSVILELNVPSYRLSASQKKVLQKKTGSKEGVS
jgi:DNA replication protein DnaC